MIFTAHQRRLKFTALDPLQASFVWMVAFCQNSYIRGINYIFTASLYCPISMCHYSYLILPLANPGFRQGPKRVCRTHPHRAPASLLGFPMLNQEQKMYMMCTAGCIYTPLTNHTFGDFSVTEVAQLSFLFIRCQGKKLNWVVEIRWHKQLHWKHKSRAIVIG